MAPRMMAAAAWLLCLAAPAAAGNWTQSPAAPYSGYGMTQPHFGSHPKLGGFENGASPATGNSAQSDPYLRCVRNHGGTTAAQLCCQVGTGAWMAKCASQPFAKSQ